MSPNPVLLFHSSWEIKPDGNSSNCGSTARRWLINQVSIPLSMMAATTKCVLDLTPVPGMMKVESKEPKAHEVSGLIRLLQGLLLRKQILTNHECICATLALTMFILLEEPSADAPAAGYR